MRVALAQINPTVGDIDGNTARILSCLEIAEKNKADLLVTPELCVFGYPPKDLVWRRSLVGRNVEAVRRIAERCTRLTALIGYVEPEPSRSGTGVYNAAAVCRRGKVTESYRKILLPTYDVFDEARYFTPGREVRTTDLELRGAPRLGLSICEDLWNDEQFEGRRVYGDDPVERTVRAGAGILVNLSASPYRAGIEARRVRLFANQIREHRVPLIYVNQVGGNDDLIFDGASLVLDRSGNVVARGKAFEEDLIFVDFEGADPQAGRVEPYPSDVASVRAALVLGIRDYLRKCDFEEVVIGLSGGIDSALTAALAVEALGASRVHGVTMPSRYSSQVSGEDARQLAENLGIRFETLSIERVHETVEAAMAKPFAGLEPGVAEENIQARIRGNMLMALSNKFHRLLLTTGNKSELAVGYCTLYGDMCGGLAVLSDVPKTLVYELSREINRTAERELIPRRTIERPPTAELRENQRDQDTLPPYDTLDAILEHYVEQDLAVEEIVAKGFDKQTVLRVVQMVDRSEYKRKQAAIGLKVTSKAFGTGRRMPIAAKYH